MARNRTRLNDRVTIKTFTKTKLPNGDISRAVASEVTYRCNATSRDTELIDRVYDIPQFKFDYVLRMRTETVTASGINVGSEVGLPDIGTGSYQVAKIIPDSERGTRVFIVSSGKSK